MPKLIVLYPPPTDAATFEKRYAAEHMPLVGKIAGLQKFVGSRVLATASGAAAPYQRVAELYFGSMASLQNAMASAAGQSAVAHALEISTGGPMTVLIAEDDPRA